MSENQRTKVGTRDTKRAAAAKTKLQRVGKVSKEIATAKKKEVSLTGPTGQKKTTARKLTMKKKK
jgi:hypothetical protein